MTSRLIRVKVLEGKESEFEALMRALVENVRAIEPDPKIYEVRKLRNDPGTFIIFQSFADDEAYDRYANSDYHVATSPNGLALLDGDPISEFLDRIQG